jgi:A/G-specific adenine glycosylase
MRKPSGEWTRALRAALLAFYDERRRDLPWRRDPDPYRVWVSEVMLQQTRVEAVIPYYERWLRRFPTLDALAIAEQDDVLRAWEGLGYYSRARNLHRAARLVRERHAGVVPEEDAALRALPGVGDYTAGAIASIAYGRARPAVDGNVRRVLARLLNVADPTPARLRVVASALVPSDRPGDFNQALMELGATACTPRNPRCETCPVAQLCRARARGTQLLRPRVRRRAEVPTFDLAVAAMLSPNAELLLMRRPDRGLLAGLWALPSADIKVGENPEVVTTWLARRCAGDDALVATRALAPLTHVFTHRREVYHAFVFEPSIVPAPPSAGDIVWAPLARLQEYPVSVGARRLIQSLGCAASPSWMKGRVDSGAAGRGRGTCPR